MFRQAELVLSRTGVRIGIHSMITRRDEYFFDLNGYTVIPQALDHGHVVSINAWIDALGTWLYSSRYSKGPRGGGRVFDRAISV